MHTLLICSHTLCIRYSYARLRYAHVTHAFAYVMHTLLIRSLTLYIRYSCARIRYAYVTHMLAYVMHTLLMRSHTLCIRYSYATMTDRRRYSRLTLKSCAYKYFCPNCSYATHTFYMCIIRCSVTAP